MTDSNRSHITLIVDRTGSMQSIRTDAEGAIRAFIAEQKAVGKPATLSLVQFDSNDPYEQLFYGDLDLYGGQYMLNPRGYTPLYDAIGSGIVKTGEVLSGLPEDRRPGEVFFVVQTDGEENASSEYTVEAVKEMVKHQEEVYGWNFIWLGTGLTATRAFENLAAGTQSVRNIVASTGSGPSHIGSYAVASSAITETRVGNKQDTYGAVVDDDGNVTNKK